MFGRDLEKGVVSDTSGHFKSLLVTMCKLRVGLGVWPVVMGVVWCRAHVRRGRQRISYVQLRATFEEYEKVGVARVWCESGNIFW